MSPYIAAPWILWDISTIISSWTINLSISHRTLQAKPQRTWRSAPGVAGPGDSYSVTTPLFCVASKTVHPMTLHCIRYTLYVVIYIINIDISSVWLGFVCIYANIPLPLLIYVPVETVEVHPDFRLWGADPATLAEQGSSQKKTHKSWQKTQHFFCLPSPPYNASLQDFIKITYREHIYTRILVHQHYGMTVYESHVVNNTHYHYIIWGHVLEFFFPQTNRSTAWFSTKVRAWTVGDESRQKDDAKRDRLVTERFVAEHPRRVGVGLRDLDL